MIWKCCKMWKDILKAPPFRLYARRKERPADINQYKGDEFLITLKDVDVLYSGGKKGDEPSGFWTPDLRMAFQYALYGDILSNKPRLGEPIIFEATDFNMVPMYREFETDYGFLNLEKYKLNYKTIQGPELARFIKNNMADFSDVFDERISGVTMEELIQILEEDNPMVSKYFFGPRQTSKKQNMRTHRMKQLSRDRYKDLIGTRAINDYDVRREMQKAEPAKGTGKKPKGSSRRLYTDENPKDTVPVKFRTAEDVRNTFASAAFKSKSHKRQSQIINLVEQRARVAARRAKDPEAKKRLLAAHKVALARKESSKKKTQRMKK